MSANIQPISPDMGQCDICDLPNRKLCFRDRTTGNRCCMACVEALRRADAFLDFWGPASGIKHPQPSY